MVCCIQIVGPHTLTREEKRELILSTGDTFRDILVTGDTTKDIEGGLT